MSRLVLTALMCFFLTDPSIAQTTTKKTPTKAAPKTKDPSTQTPKAEPAPVVATDGKININTATIAELNKLNGVGDVTAKNIIAYREANGPFKTTDDLNKVTGIGDKTFAKFKDQITVGDGKTTAITTETKTTATPAVSAGPLININTATAAELNKLSGVGDVTAKKIIEYREANGPFKTIDDLKKVTGIGDKTYEKFKAQITVDGSVSGAAPVTTASKEAPVVGVVPTVVAAGPKININTASLADLKKLNGVGDVTAKNIIAYREANGPFKTIEDINKVTGIGDKTYAKFKDQLSVGDNTGATTATPTETPAVTKTTAAATVNINTADLKELGKLPGVGDTTAQRILEYRTANGPFKTCKDLGKVKGIGDKTLEKIEPSCTVK